MRGNYSGNGATGARSPRIVIAPVPVRLDLHRLAERRGVDHQAATDVETHPLGGLGRERPAATSTSTAAEFFVAAGRYLRVGTVSGSWRREVRLRDLGLPGEWAVEPDSGQVAVLAVHDDQQVIFAGAGRLVTHGGTWLGCRPASYGPGRHTRERSAPDREVDLGESFGRLVSTGRHVAIAVSQPARRQRWDGTDLDDGAYRKIRAVVRHHARPRHTGDGSWGHARNGPRPGPRTILWPVVAAVVSSALTLWVLTSATVRTVLRSDSLVGSPRR